MNPIGRTESIHAEKTFPGQVWGRTTWVTEGGDFCPMPQVCPYLVSCYCHFWWLKSHQPRKNQRQLDLVADILFLWNYFLCFTESVHSLWSSVWNVPLLQISCSSIFSFFFLFFSIFWHAAAKRNTSTSVMFICWYIQHCEHVLALYKTWLCPTP